MNIYLKKKSTYVKNFNKPQIKHLARITFREEKRVTTRKYISLKT